MRAKNQGEVITTGQPISVPAGFSTTRSNGPALGIWKIAMILRVARAGIILTVASPVRHTHCRFTSERTPAADGYGFGGISV